LKPYAPKMTRVPVEGMTSFCGIARCPGEGAARELNVVEPATNGVSWRGAAAATGVAS